MKQIKIIQNINNYNQIRDESDFIMPTGILKYLRIVS